MNYPDQSHPSWPQDKTIILFVNFLLAKDAKIILTSLSRAFSHHFICSSLIGYSNPNGKFFPSSLEIIIGLLFVLWTVLFYKEQNTRRFNTITTSGNRVAYFLYLTRNIWFIHLHYCSAICFVDSCVLQGTETLINTITTSRDRVAYFLYVTRNSWFVIIAIARLVVICDKDVNAFAK